MRSSHSLSERVESRDREVAEYVDKLYHCVSYVCEVGLESLEGMWLSVCAWPGLAASRISDGAWPFPTKELCRMFRFCSGATFRGGGL